MEYPGLAVETWERDALGLRERFQVEMYGLLPETEALEEVGVEEIGEGVFLRTFVSRKGLRIVALHAVPKGAVRGTFVGVNFSGNHTVLDSPLVPEPEGWSYPDGELWPVSRGCHAER